MKKIIQDLISRIKGYRIFALVGKSGTGKSYRAQPLAEKLNIDLIIDDGLLIAGDKIIAGHSAKHEQNFLGAIKVALFDDKDHRDNVAKELQNHKSKKILILGTSEKMVNKIAIRLQIPRPQKIILIEEIAKKEEIETAIRSRSIEGKHVIPVASIEIKRNYPQIFYDKIRLMFQRKKNAITPESNKYFEKSLVRPVFSKVGTVEISKAALEQSLKKYVEEYDPNIVIKKTKIRLENSGYRLVITVDVPFLRQLTEHIDKLQKHIILNIEKYTGASISGVNIVIDKIKN
ncbi:MAG: hypothetical protein CR988_03730 [Treponema sp.]|nr:MAG: hypothetical protein CR988_03730 [Treponema sp.]